MTDRATRALPKLMLALGILLCASASFVAWADEAPTLQQLKQAGQVGERVDGYVGIVAAEIDATARAVVERINAERRAAYEKIATQQGVSADEVAALAGAKLVAAAPTGQLVQDSTGSWKQK